jgi:hypothetical protein
MNKLIHFHLKYIMFVFLFSPYVGHSPKGLLRKSLLVGNVGLVNATRISLFNGC